MADQEYENLTSQIKDLKQRLSDSAGNPQEAKEIEETIERLQRKAVSYGERYKSTGTGVSVDEPASSSGQAVVNDPYMQAEDDETVNVAESAAAAVSQKEKVQRDELSERARENLLQISQAPDVGPEVQVLPSGKPGIDYAQQNMIRQLQTTIAPAFVLERLEKKPTPTSQTKSADPQKPKPQARQKVKITFQKQVQQPEAGEAASEAEVSRGVTIIDKRDEDMVNRADILERLRTVLPVHISKASDSSKPQSQSSKRLQTFIPDAAAAEADTSLLTR